MKIVLSMIERALRATALVSAAFFICLVLLTASVCASGATINGFVCDRDHQAVANATVTLLKDNEPLPTVSNPAHTDTNGYYEFWGIDRGVYCLVASKGFHSYSSTIRVEGRDVMQNFTLPASSAELADTLQPTPTMLPSVTPAATAAPVTTATPVPEASPGPGLFLVFPGIYAAVRLACRKKGEV